MPISVTPIQFDMKATYALFERDGMWVMFLAELVNGVYERGIEIEWETDSLEIASTLSRMASQQLEAKYATVIKSQLDHMRQYLNSLG